jgi:hypothetical protein
LIDEISRDEKQLKSLCSDRQYRPVEWEWKDMLATFDIAFQQSYTMQLVGERIYRFMDNYKEIIVKSMELILANISHSKIKQTPESVTSLFDGLSKLLEYLYFINDVMISMDKLSEETIDDVDQAVRQFADLYRFYFEKDAPPKIHWLEVHLVRKLRIFSRVGPNREDPIEHEHQIHNRERIKASNIRNYLQLQQVVDRRIGASYIPNVAAIINSMSCKRNFSSKSKEKQQEKIEISKNEKNLKLEEWKK